MGLIQYRWVKKLVDQSDPMGLTFYQKSPGYHVLKQRDARTATIAFKYPVLRKLPEHLQYCTEVEAANLERLDKSELAQPQAGTSDEPEQSSAHQDSLANPAPTDREARIKLIRRVRRHNLTKPEFKRISRMSNEELEQFVLKKENANPPPFYQEFLPTNNEYF